MPVTPPRIAIFVATSGHSGVDRAMKNLIPALAARGYLVDLLKVRQHGPNLHTPLPPGVRVIDLGSRHVYTSLGTLVRYLQENRPHVVLADKDRVNRTALLARWLAGVETHLVLSSGTTISVDLEHRTPFDRWQQRNSMGKLYRFADQIIVTCDGVADDMAEYTGLRRDLITSVPSPVLADDVFTQHFSKPNHPWYHDQIPLVLGTGELSKRKDFATLIEAVALVNQKLPCRLMILGKGREHANLQALVEERQMQERVALPGFVDHPLNYMAHANLFAFSSQWEGLGFVMIEALSVGTPVVATDCPSGPREILQDGKIGRLVPVGDAQRMASAIVQQLTSRPTQKTLLQDAVRKYSISAATDAYLDIFGLPHQFHGRPLAALNEASS